MPPAAVDVEVVGEAADEVELEDAPVVPLVVLVVVVVVGRFR